jgi:hypothetical protein
MEIIQDLLQLHFQERLLVRQKGHNTQPILQKENLIDNSITYELIFLLHIKQSKLEDYNRPQERVDKLDRVWEITYCHPWFSFNKTKNAWELLKDFPVSNTPREWDLCPLTISQSIWGCFLLMNAINYRLMHQKRSLSFPTKINLRVLWCNTPQKTLQFHNPVSIFPQLICYSKKSGMVVQRKAPNGHDWF